MPHSPLFPRVWVVQGYVVVPRVAPVGGDRTRSRMTPHFLLAGACGVRQDS